MPFNQLQLMIQLGEYILGFFKLNLKLFLEKNLFIMILVARLRAVLMAIFV